MSKCIAAHRFLPAEIGRLTSNHCEDKMAPKDGWDSGIASAGNNFKRLKF